MPDDKETAALKQAILEEMQRLKADQEKSLNVMQMLVKREYFESGHLHKSSWKIDVEDIVAIGAVLVALVFATGMINQAIPINKYTIAVAGLSGGGAAVASIVAARKKSKGGHSVWFERSIWLLALLVLAASFAAYVWWA